MSYEVPENLKYTADHEWAQESDGIVTVGITDFAQSSLGDIVFVELPEAGTTISKGDSFGVVESIKSVSDLYAPVSGEVLESNGDLEGQPDLLNQGPYTNWLIKIKMSSPDESGELLGHEQYTELQSE